MNSLNVLYSVIAIQIFDVKVFTLVRYGVRKIIEKRRNQMQIINYLWSKVQDDEILFRRLKY